MANGNARRPDDDALRRMEERMAEERRRRESFVSEQSRRADLDSPASRITPSRETQEEVQRTTRNESPIANRPVSREDQIVSVQRSTGEALKTLQARTGITADTEGIEVLSQLSGVGDPSSVSPQQIERISEIAKRAKKDFKAMLDVISASKEMAQAVGATGGAGVAGATIGMEVVGDLRARGRQVSEAEEMETVQAATALASSKRAQRATGALGALEIASERTDLTRAEQQEIEETRERIQEKISQGRRVSHGDLAKAASLATGERIRGRAVSFFFEAEQERLDAALGEDREKDIVEDVIRGRAERIRRFDPDASKYKIAERIQRELGKDASLAGMNLSGRGIINVLEGRDAGGADLSDAAKGAEDRGGRTASPGDSQDTDATGETTTRPQTFAERFEDAVKSPAILAGVGGALVAAAVTEGERVPVEDGRPLVRTTEREGPAPAEEREQQWEEYTEAELAARQKARDQVEQQGGDLPSPVGEGAPDDDPEISHRERMVRRFESEGLTREEAEQEFDSRMEIAERDRLKRLEESRRRDRRIAQERERQQTQAEREAARDRGELPESGAQGAVPPRSTGFQPTRQQQVERPEAQQPATIGDFAAAPTAPSGDNRLMEQMLREQQKTNQLLTQVAVNSGRTAPDSKSVSRQPMQNV